MIILAIETSCDDTAVAIVEAKTTKTVKKEPKFNILSSVVSSQADLHQKYGGVYPFLAKREHEKNLPRVFDKAMIMAKNPKIDAIAATVGPGLEPCLWQGVNFANDLAKEMKIPLIAVNHIEAHILANWLKPIRSNFPIYPPLAEKSSPKRTFSIFKFQKISPAICLIVSGGHTQLILMKAIGKYEILGETRDDAAGECFDKTARILGLGYPGGPAIAATTAKIKTKLPTTNYKLQTKLPRPMINTKDYDFSFSGLKTAVLYLVKNLKAEKKFNKDIIQEICFEIQQSIIDVLLKKTIKAVKDCRAKSVILAGGVSANKELRKQLKTKVEKEIPGAHFLVPDLKYCTDNAVMVGIAAFFQKKRWKTIKANANLRIDKVF